MGGLKGKIRIAEKEYDVEVIDGVRYIDGVTVEEFLQRLPLEERRKLAMTGAVVLEAMRDGINISPKKVLESMYEKPN